MSVRTGLGQVWVLNIAVSAGPGGVGLKVQMGSGFNFILVQTSNVCMPSLSKRLSTLLRIFYQQELVEKC